MAGRKGTSSGGEDDKGRARMEANNGGDNGSDISGEGNRGAVLLEDEPNLKAAASLKYLEGSNLLKEDVGGADCNGNLGGVKNPSRALKYVE